MEVEGRFWIKEQGKNFLGHGKVELLELIDKSGSISQAAKTMKMSYKAAWDSIDSINKLSKEPLVCVVRGGKSGGGAKLTQKGLKLIKIFRQMESLNEVLLNVFKNDLESLEDSTIENPLHFRSVTMKTSARNQLQGEIIEIKTGKVNAEAILKTRNNLTISSIITMSSLDELGLKVGMKCYALIKANWIVVFDEKPSKISMKNCIKGEVTNIINGAINCQVEINSNGEKLSAIITESSQDSIKLNIGDKVWFGFKANNVILGI